MNTQDEFTIDSMDVSAYTVPTDFPESDGTLSWKDTTVVVVQPRTRSGITGLGYSYGHPCMVQLIRETLSKAVTGLDIRDVPGAWLAMVRAIRNLGRPGLVSMAIAAVDIALWDTKARCLQQPLHQLLGAATKRVPVYASGGFTSYSDERLAAQLTSWVESGFPRVKIKIGNAFGSQPGADLDRVRLARSVIGDKVELYVDANGAYDRTTARTLGQRFAADYDVSWFEEPVTSDDRSGLAMLAAELPLDVTAGEYGYSLEYFQTMVAAQAVDVLQADVARCAGITEWLRVAALAAANKLSLSAHCGPSLHVHVAASISNLRHLEYFHDHVLIDHQLFDGILEPKEGYLQPTEAPGLGLTLKKIDADRFRVT